jgi:EAL domain-containing protein (putative c-di-GMP-specific phosphodiesterase class I)/CheY-like chemotaxis protein
MTTLSHASDARIAFVLDDEPQVGSLTCKMLRSMGVVGRQFVSAPEFFAELNKTSPEWIILDLALGQTDAVEVLRQLGLLKFSGNVLLMSGRDHGTLQEISRIGHARGLRMLPTMEKPFRAADLKKRLLAAQPADPASAATSSIFVDPPKPRVKADLSEALQNNWLEVWYQPKFALGSLSICGAEALARVRHPEHGIIEPAQFLPPTGDPLYHALSLFVVRQAMTDWPLLADHGLALPLAINIPPSILNTPGFVSSIRGLLPPDPNFPGLIMEITEDEFILDPVGVYEIAAQLRLYNIWTSIDDFGTANASLSRLKDVSFAELKLDRSFVSNCGTDPMKRILCQSVVDLAHRFDASICAEGVETEEELRCVTQLGFDTAQGYLFAKPMPLRELIDFSWGKALSGVVAEKSNASPPVKRRARA